jgi:TRAP-type transport system small permease protein
MMHPLRATIRWLCWTAEAIAIVALIAVTALIMTQIVAREIFVAGLSWADELARYAGLTVIFMGVPTLLARDEHVKVDMFLNMMPARPRHFFNITNDALMVVFAAMFLVAGWQFMQRAAQFSTPALGMPNLIFYMPAAIGMTLLFFVAIDRAVAALTLGAKDEANTQ